MTIFECAVKVATVTPIGLSNVLYPFSPLLQSGGVAYSKIGYKIWILTRL